MNIVISGTVSTYHFSSWRNHALICFFLCTFLAASASATIDTAINKTVWKLAFGLTDAQVNDPAWMALDTDGDGLTNDEELTAGTNPLRANSTDAISGATADPNYAYLTFPSAKGKLYGIESTTALDVAGSWAPLSPAVQGIGDGN